ncbi:radical SAM family heme chaperone HemW [Corynebacterium felinum]|uniref:Heme chaperone HemW n=1 Tax=Corynebacterium felinum TaxID=131318 RepID=A0ABU2B4E5_9CORY|nr:radical SAM family heme chaperone HemW [Corynebacterium felinum]MDF5821425.1 radical SAM family heme chaperone HemW [Corynebacterium felinum]MDR7353485.1 oxygen-independent coproporphyrinogen-3 oxidase [Corynebacterium felinum]WJY95664.1 Oxygen-independent coproporphyrinogen-III oxidase 1 [Corynebacterium felinum]
MFGVYIHVPFCASRCGYCDFNTYTPGELGTSASPESYMQALSRELDMAAAQVGQQAQTVFIGGGTPSMLGADGLGKVLEMVRGSFGLAPGAEITTECNPESTSLEFFDSLLGAGFNRISLGMQSASAGVLRVLERAHTPGRAFAAVREAKAAGFTHVNLDMIYGTPTETDQDVRDTLEQVLDTGVDHVSAYALIVEDGTRMARKVRSGQLPAPDEDAYADRFEMIDSALLDAGYDWYEVSNWAKPGGQCQHNLGYWRNHDWWGAGPGAHSHLDGHRFFNVKHPRTYADAVAAEKLPIKESEWLSEWERHEEKVMLGLRLKEGLPAADFSESELAVAQGFADRGLLEVGKTVALTSMGRLLADGMIADILLAGERD